MGHLRAKSLRAGGTKKNRMWNSYSMDGPLKTAFLPKCDVTTRGTPPPAPLAYVGGSVPSPPCLKKSWRATQGVALTIHFNLKHQTFSFLGLIGWDYQNHHQFKTLCILDSHLFSKWLMFLTLHSNIILVMSSIMIDSLERPSYVVCRDWRHSKALLRRPSWYTR